MNCFLAVSGRFNRRNTQIRISTYPWHGRDADQAPSVHPRECGVKPADLISWTLCGPGGVLFLYIITSGWPYCLGLVRATLSFCVNRKTLYFMMDTFSVKCCFPPDISELQQHCSEPILQFSGACIHWRLLRWLSLYFCILLETLLENFFGDRLRNPDLFWFWPHEPPHRTPFQKFRSTNEWCTVNE